MTVQPFPMPPDTLMARLHHATRLLINFKACFKACRYTKILHKKTTFIKPKYIDHLLFSILSENDYKFELSIRRYLGIYQRQKLKS